MSEKPEVSTPQNVSRRLDFESPDSIEGEPFTPPTEQNILRPTPIRPPFSDSDSSYESPTTVVWTPFLPPGSTINPLLSPIKIPRSYFNNSI